MDNILTAKKELYRQLKAQHQEVTGAGIQQKNGAEVIVIFLSRMNAKLCSLIPAQYKGNKVQVQLRSVAKAM
jgi:hypothetical protein